MRQIVWNSTKSGICGLGIYVRHEDQITLWTEQMRPFLLQNPGGPSCHNLNLWLGTFKKIILNWTVRLKFSNFTQQNGFIHEKGLVRSSALLEPLIKCAKTV